MLKDNLAHMIPDHGTKVPLPQKQTRGHEMAKFLSSLIHRVEIFKREVEKLILVHCLALKVNLILYENMSAFREQGFLQGPSLVFHLASCTALAGLQGVDIKLIFPIMTDGWVRPGILDAPGDAKIVIHPSCTMMVIFASA